MSLSLQSLFKSPFKVFQHHLLAFNDALPQKWSRCHPRCAKLQILSILRLPLLCPNFKLELSNLLVIDRSFQIACDLAGWILWWPLWISRCDFQDLLLEELHTVQQCHLHCCVDLGIIKLKFAHSYLIISHKTSKWSSFPSNPGVVITSLTSYQTPSLSLILSPSVTVGPMSNLILWVVLMYSTCWLTHLLYCSCLKSKRHLIPVALALGHVISISQMVFRVSTLGHTEMMRLKSFAKLLKRLFAMVYTITGLKVL